MDFTEFTEEIRRLISERNDRMDISIQTVRKNNSVLYTGLTVRGMSNTSAPIIYLEPYYRMFRDTSDMDRVADEIIRVYQQNTFQFNPDFIIDVDIIKDRIVYQVINEHRNKDFLIEVPHRSLIDDIAVTYKILLDHNGDDMSASIRIDNSLMDLWSASEEMLWTYAKKNTNMLQKPVYIGLDDLIIGMRSGQQLLSGMVTKGEPFDAGIRMFVATNEGKVNGASVMADKGFMKKLHSEIGDFYIIPSSIHEIIAVPTTEVFDVDMLYKMVIEVNSTSVSEEDYLSDTVYSYDGNVITVA